MRKDDGTEGFSGWYLGERLDFDMRLIRFRDQTLLAHQRGREGQGLEPAEVEITGTGLRL